MQPHLCHVCRGSTFMPKERAILICAFTQNGIPTSFSNAEVSKILNLIPEAKKIYDRLHAQKGGEARKANNTLRKALVPNKAN